MHVLVSTCVTPLIISPAGQPPTIGSDSSPDSRVGIYVPAFMPHSETDSRVELCHAVWPGEVCDASVISLIVS